MATIKQLKQDEASIYPATIIAAIKDEKNGEPLRDILDRLHIEAQTTVGPASQTSAGLMSAADKTKLDSLSNYSIATENTAGIVKVGDRLYTDLNGRLCADDYSSKFNYIQGMINQILAQNPQIVPYKNIMFLTSPETFNIECQTIDDTGGSIDRDKTISISITGYGYLSTSNQIVDIDVSKIQWIDSSLMIFDANNTTVADIPQVCTDWAQNLSFVYRSISAMGKVTGSFQFTLQANSATSNPLPHNCRVHIVGEYNYDGVVKDVAIDIPIKFTQQS